MIGRLFGPSSRLALARSETEPDLLGQRALGWILASSETVRGMLVACSVLELEADRPSKRGFRYPASWEHDSAGPRRFGVGVGSAARDAGASFAHDVGGAVILNSMEYIMVNYPCRLVAPGAPAVPAVS